MHMWQRVCIGLCLAAVLYGDTLYLKNGEHLRGEITKEDSRIIIQLEYGRASFHPDEVERIEEEPRGHLLAAQAEEALHSRDFTRAWELRQEWADTGELHEEAAAFEQEYYQQLALDLLHRGAIAKAREYAWAITDQTIARDIHKQIQLFEEKLNQQEQKARQAFETGKYRDAVIAYRSIYFLSQERYQTIRDDLLLAYQLLGEQYLAAGQHADAEQVYDQLLALAPELFDRLRGSWVQVKLALINDIERQQIEYENIIVTLADIGADDPAVLLKAAQAAHKVELYGIAARYAGEILGRPAAGIHAEISADAAAILLERAAEAVKNNTWAGRYSARLIPDSDVYTVSSRHFRVDAPDPAAAVRAARILEHGLRSLQEALPAGSKDLLEGIVCLVSILPDREAYLAIRPEGDEDAVTNLIARDGNLEHVLILTHAQAEGLYLNVLAHELGHAVLSLYTGDSGNLPLWLQEGFAVWSEPLFKKNYYKNLLGNALRNGKLFSLPQLLGITAYPAGKSDFYAQAYSFTDYLMQVHGVQAFLDFAAEGSRNGINTVLPVRHGAHSIRSLQKPWISHIRTLCNI